MEYYTKTGQKTKNAEKAAYKVQTADVTAYNHFKQCLKTAKESALYLRMAPIEWAIIQNRLCYGADKAGYIER